jgi:hypothetical protein
MLNFWTREQCEQYQMMHFGISCATCERWDDECFGSIWTVKQARVRRKKCLRRQRDPCIHHCCTPKGPRARILGRKPNLNSPDTSHGDSGLAD